MTAYHLSKGHDLVKKIALIGLAMAALAACGPKESQVQRIKDENGTEIVLNKMEPAKLKGSPASLELTEEWTINTGDDAVADSGLADIGLFDVDSRGNVYFAVNRGTGPAVVKFDAMGKPAGSFGRRGQGPGEIQDISALFVTSRDEAAVTSEGNNRLTIFDGAGQLVWETTTAPGHITLAPLPNGMFLTIKRIPDPKPDALFEFPIAVTGSDLKPVRDLDTGFIENPMTGERLRGTYHIQSWSVSRDRIFTGHQDRGYDIFVFDLDGRPVRKIRKEFAPVPVPEAFKKEFLGQFDAPQFKVVRDKVYFPSDMPPYIGFTADEDGRLYVMTYETSERPGEFVFDIFNADGIFILRKPIEVFQDYGGAYFKVRNGRFYCVRQNSDGETLFKVFKMTWK